MTHLVTSSCNTSAYPGSTLHGFWDKKKAIVTMEDGQFNQLGVQERIRELIIFSPTEIQAITFSGEKRVIHASWPHFSTQEQFKAYLTNAFIMITPINNGDLQLRSAVRCLGGGQDPSKEKRTGGVRTPKQNEDTNNKFNFLRFSSALDHKNHAVALQELEKKITPTDTIHVCLPSAIKNNWVDVVSKIIEKSHHTLSAKSFGNFASLSAEMVKCLMNHGAPLNEKIYGHFPLHEAAADDRADIVESMLRHMLQHGIDPNNAGGDILEAILFNRSKLISIMFDKDFISRSDHLDLTTHRIYLLDAVQKNNSEIISILLSKGVILHSDLTLHPEYLLEAIKYKRSEMISLLISNGINPQDPKIQTELQQLLPNLCPEIRQLLTQNLGSKPEFQSAAAILATKIIRSLQGELYTKVEAAQKIEELQSVLVNVLIYSSSLREFLFMPSSSSTAPKRQALIDIFKKWYYPVSFHKVISPYWY